MKRIFLLLSVFCIVCLSTIRAQITVDFTTSDTEACGSLSVNFCDASTSTAGTITSWEWDICGVAATDECPGRVITTPTVCTVCLTVMDDAGNTETLCKDDLISVYALPEPDFEAVPAEGCSPLDVVFNDLSTSSDGTITEWTWGLGGSSAVLIDDGTASEISSTYTATDSYNISLTVKDSNGCTNTISKDDVVTVHPDPTINIEASETFTCTPPLQVDFTNLSNTQNIEYSWDFGNGETFSGVTPPTVEYVDAGSYSISVIAVNTVTNCTDTLVLDRYIQVGYPVDFSFTPDNGCGGAEFTFTDLSTTPADSILWDFGDGTTSTMPNQTHTYGTSGCFTVSLTRFIEGCNSFYSTPTCISVADFPTVDHNIDNLIGCSLPHTVNFEGISPTGVEWRWKLGVDGSEAVVEDQNFTYTFTEYGRYPVLLRATNAEGCASTIKRDTIEIIEMIPDIVEGQLLGCAPLTFSLKDTTESVAPITGWSWEIETPTNTFTSTESNPTFTIPDTGCFNIVLEVTNSLGCVSTKTFDNHVCLGLQPTVNFEVDTLENCINQPFNFTDLSSDFTNLWAWDFDSNGSIDSYQQNPSWEYSDTGRYDVTLQAFHYGCAAEVTFEDYINILPALAKFRPVRNCDDPYTIEFKDRSIGADSLFWDFGVEGVTTDTSSLEDVFFTFPDTGYYLITQYVFNTTTGCADSANYTAIITDPKADFTIPNNKGCAPFIVDVENNSEFAVQWKWSVTGGDFSDNKIAEPSITFQNPGVYTDLELIITDLNGCTDTLMYPDTIFVNELTANFNLTPEGGCIPLDVQFSDLSATLYTDIVDWNWIIGDTLTQLSGETPSYTFNDIGQFPITLQITDEWGCTDEIRKAGVEATQPTAYFEMDSTSCTKDAINFYNQSQGVDMDYLWDFGDGTTSTMENPAHLYIAEGIYSVCLTVTDKYGCDSTFCRNNEIIIADPIAAFTLDTASANCPPLIVNFENQSQNASSYIWDFGDNSGTSTLENPPHIYTSPGSFDVSLIAIATGNCSDTLTVPGQINLLGPEGDFSFTVDAGCIPTQVTFMAQSVDNYDYIWDFGNGVLDTTQNVMADTFTYAYTQIGEFIPKLILVDGATGCQRTFESPDAITTTGVKADFAASDSIMCVDDATVLFSNLTNSSAPIVEWDWRFNLGTSPPAGSNEIEPTYTYNSAGAFDVQLIARNAVCADTVTKTTYIRVGDLPDTNFGIEQLNGCDNQTISFNDSTTIGMGTIATLEWDFGDTNTTTEQNPAYQFPGAGNYDVSLTATSDFGCSNTFTETINVFTPPTISAGQNIQICNGDATQLQGTILTDPTGLTYQWLPSPTLSCTDCLDPYASPGDTTTYFFTATNQAGCSDTAQVTVYVSPFSVPDVAISNDTTICINDPIQLFVSGGEVIYDYTWDDTRPGLNCYEACINPIAFPLETTTYIVSVTNSYGCEAIDSVTISVVNEFEPLTIEDETICLGDQIQLTTTTGNEPVWSPSENLDCVSCPNPMATPIETTTFRVDVITDSGCAIYDSVTITVLTPDDIDAGEDAVVCAGESIQLEGQGDGIINWSPSSTLDNSTVLNPYARPAIPTNYILTVENGDCILEDSVFIDVVLSTDLEGVDVTICQGDTTELEVMGEADSYFWTPTDQVSNPNIANPLVAPEETSTYTLVGRLATCAPDSTSVTVNIIDEPDVYLPAVYYYFPGQPVDMKITSADPENFSYQWSSLGNLTCVTCPNPTIQPVDTMTMSVEVIDNATGCSTILTTILMPLSKCGEDLIGMPTIFTPNGDGNNDVLEMYTATIDQIEEFMIFDRWGTLLFAANDITATWDGTYKGKKVDSGVYVYFIKFICELDGKEIVKKGDITIMR